MLPRADALVMAIADLAHELVCELVDRGLHVAGSLARAQRPPLEVDDRLGDLRVGDGRVLLHCKLELDSCRVVDTTLELSELPLGVASDRVIHLEVLALDVKFHRSLPS